MNKRLFFDISTIPGLINLENNYLKLKEEALSICDTYKYVDAYEVDMDTIVKDRNEEPRTKLGEWLIYDVFTQLDNHKKLFNFSHNLIMSIPNIEFYVYSNLKAGGTIKVHSHDNNKISCIFPLTCGDDTYIEVDGDRRYLKEGKCTLFDYSYNHTVFNKSKIDRLAILLKFPIT